MGKFSEYIGSQFGNPRGFIGKCCCVIMNVINKAMYRRIVSEIKADKGSRVLDIGYGNGYLIRLIYKKFRSDIYGIDISADMKIAAEKRNKKAEADGRLHLELGDCCQLRYEDSFFDAVTSVNTVYFWNNTLKGMEEICRTLKPGGVFYNVVYTKEWLQKLSYTKKGFRFFEPEELIKLGKQAGFSEVAIHEIAKGKSFMAVSRKQ